MINNGDYYVFTTFKVINNQAWFLNEHYKRLFLSCYELKISFKISYKEFIKLLQIEIKAYKENNLRIKVIIKDEKILFKINVLILHKYSNYKLYLKSESERMDKSNLKYKISTNIVYKSPNKGYLYFDNNKFISESNIANIFAIKNGKIYTSKSNNILNGITKQFIEQICDVIKINMEYSFLLSAEKVFLTNSLNIFEVKYINDILINNKESSIYTNIIKEYKSNAKVLTNW